MTAAAGCLLGYTVQFLALAVRAYTQDQRRKVRVALDPGRVKGGTCGAVLLALIGQVSVPLGQGTHDSKEVP
jgi:hypothetical protein